MVSLISLGVAVLQSFPGSHRRPSSTRASLLLTDHARLNYVVQAKIYDEAPSELVTTSRGSGPYVGGGAINASVSVLSLGTDGSARIMSHWAAPTAVEGQDRLGSLLVVVDIGRGGLFTFNASDIAAGPIGYTKCSADAALHVRLCE